MSTAGFSGGAQPSPYPPIADYALIGDCHSAALVSRAGSIDWCCLPRFDSDACFGRLVDWRKGGHCAIAPLDPDCRATRAYLPGTLVLETTFTCPQGEAKLYDFFAMRAGGRRHPRRQLLRVLEGMRGRVAFRLEISPRLDFGAVLPWIHPHSNRLHTVVGSNKGLIVSGDIDLALDGDHDLAGEIVVGAGERRRLSIQFIAPEERLDAAKGSFVVAEIDQRLEETVNWWRQWASRISLPDSGGACTLRSAIVLKALTYAPTGAIVAAPTTSLPETPGGTRNWDYRFSWIRDSIFTVHALASLGCEPEAGAFRRFIERAAAGNADDLQVLFAVDGMHRLPEIVLPELEGYRGARPVRVGNAAAEQFQADLYGLILEQTWRWRQRGAVIEDHYWKFLEEVVNAAVARAPEPDHGIWEIRAAPRHYVHSKAMCWAALNRGIALARLEGRRIPDAWPAMRDRLHAAIETEGYDRARGVFVQHFGSTELDAALLLLPAVEFVDWRDERMMRTADAIREDLDDHGLILRYRNPDGLEGREGTFIACSFWLAECLARQGRKADAQAVYERALACANDLGLFSEEYDVAACEMLGNFPQGLTHLSHISAALAMAGEFASVAGEHAYAA
jgi:GH15 family glucan-1,4-alpha-glucosidase